MLFDFWLELLTYIEQELHPGSALNHNFTIPRFDSCCLYFMSCLYAFLVGDYDLEMVRWLVTLSQSDAFLVS